MPGSTGARRHHLTQARASARPLLEPTRIYVKPVLGVARATGAVKALAHITGGGLTENLPRVLPEGLAAEIALDRLAPPPVFAWIADAGAIAVPEMLRTFNCGVGMAAVVAEAEAETVSAAFAEAGETASVIGRLMPRGDGEPVCAIRAPWRSDDAPAQTDRRADLGARQQHAGADRGLPRAGLSGRDRAGDLQPARRARSRPRRGRGHCHQDRRPQGLPDARGLRGGARRRAARGGRRDRLQCGLHAPPHRLVRRALARPQLNIHPSLLPAFKGLDTHARAIASGVRIAGCTVHFVRTEMDAGPIIAQAAVPVLAGDAPEDLAARVLEAEHEIYPLALRLVASGEAKVEGELVRLPDAGGPGGRLIAPGG